jgi:hypothetical protein
VCLHALVLVLATDVGMIPVTCRPFRTHQDQISAIPCLHTPLLAHSILLYSGITAVDFKSNYLLAFIRVKFGTSEFFKVIGTAYLQGTQYLLVFGAQLS